MHHEGQRKALHVVMPRVASCQNNLSRSSCREVSQQAIPDQVKNLKCNHSGAGSQSLGYPQHGNPAVRHRCTHTTYKLLISQTLRNPSQLTLQKSLIILFQVPSSCSSMDTSMAIATAATVCSCARSRTFVVEILPDCTKVCFAYSRGFTPHAGLPDSLSPCTSGGGFHIIRRTPISDFADDDSNCTTNH